MRSYLTNNWKFACQPQASILYQAKSLKGGPVRIFLDHFATFKQPLHKTWVYLQIDFDARNWNEPVSSVKADAGHTKRLAYDQQGSSNFACAADSFLFNTPSPQISSLTEENKHVLWINESSFSKETVVQRRWGGEPRNEASYRSWTFQALALLRYEWSKN